MNDHLTVLFAEFERLIRAVGDREKPVTEAELLDQLRHLRGGIELAIEGYDKALAKRGPRVPSVSLDGLTRSVEGRDILSRAWKADPRRTEADLFSLGAREAASVIGAEYLAAFHRGELQLEMYEEAP